jgi:uncharacterized membrane protein
MGFSWIFLASFALLFIGMVVMMIASFTQGHGTTSGGAVILIGPIPIILGNGPRVKLVDSIGCDNHRDRVGGI